MKAVPPYLFLAYMLLMVLSCGTHASSDKPPGTANNSANSPMVYRYWDWGLTQKRDDYQIAVLTLALENTRADFGDYRLLRVRENFTAERALREIQAGELFNLHAAPARSPTHKLAQVTEDTSIAVDVPLLNGLLGFRRLIVRKDDLHSFETMKPEQLKTLTAGQGTGWEDVYIFRQNGFLVNDDGNYLALTTMLLAKRFDYLPLSIIEAENLRAQSENASQLVLVDNLMIYYPLPLYFYVSKKEPRLAARLQQGIELAQQDGSLDALLETHFAEEIASLKTGKGRLILLKNPSVPAHTDLHKPAFIKPELWENQ